MSQQQQSTPNTDLINQVRKGNNMQARTRTLINGLLKGAQVAHNAGGTNFSDWYSQQAALIDNYCEAVETGTTGAQASKGGAGQAG